MGVYCRGTARLSDGRAEVTLPEHFGQVANDAGLTANLTARSGESKGVAATELTTRRLVVEELGSGRGAYDVDYMIHGVRRGREDYRVVRPVRPPRAQG